MIQKFLIVFLLLFSVFSWAAGQIKFEVIIDKKTVALDDSLTLRYVLSSSNVDIGEEDIQFPEFEKDFEVMNQFVQNQTSSIFEGGSLKLERKKVYTFSLVPKKAGKFKIDKAEVKISGDTLNTQPIDVTVVAQGAPSRPSQKAQKGRPQQNLSDEDDEDVFSQMDEDAQDLFSQLLKRHGFNVDRRGGVQSLPPQGGKDAFFIAVHANKKKVYVGEQIVVNWYLYTRGNIQKYEAVKYPELKGFWKEELELSNRLNFEKEVVNGVTYNKALLISYALFPISAGKKTIDQYQAKGTIIDLNGGMGVFGMGRPFSYSKASKELPIEVIPLPTEGKPASFSGAVGGFSVTGSLSATQAKVNQPVSLKIRFSGQGNVRAIELPPLNLPSNLEIYDTKNESQYSKTGEGFKEFEVLIIPRNTGAVTIPPVEVSYFDPQKSKYVVQKTPEFKLNVIPGDGSQPGNNLPFTGGESVKDEIRYLKTTKNLYISPKALSTVWILLFFAAWGWFGFEFYMFWRGGHINTTALLKKKVKAKLKTAKQKLKSNDWRGVGVECSNAILSTLGELSGFSGASLTVEKMFAAWKGATPELQNQVHQLLNRCELLSFAPEIMIEQQKSSSELQKIISDTEKLISDLFRVGGLEGSSSPNASSEARLKTS